MYFHSDNSQCCNETQAPLDYILTMLQIYAQGESDSNGRIELVKTTRDSQVLGSFSEGRSRAFSIASKDSKLTDQNSYRVRL